MGYDQDGYYKIAPPEDAYLWVKTEFLKFIPAEQVQKEVEVKKAVTKQIEIIKLYGSMELAPIVGLADIIVDVVDTGNTLKANGLIPLEHMADISSRIVVNSASMKTKHKKLQTLLDQLKQAVEAKWQN